MTGFAFGGLKIFADGALGPRTAYMIDPYEGEPDNFGISTIDKEEMAELVSRASAFRLALYHPRDWGSRRS